MTDWTKYKQRNVAPTEETNQALEPEVSEWDKYKLNLKKKVQGKPLPTGSKVGGPSPIPVQDLPLAYEESKAGLFDKLAESIQTPQEKSGFRTVQEMGKAKLPSGVTMEKTQSKPIDFDAEDRSIEAEQKEQREVARLNVKDKYETIKPKLDEFKGIISQQKSDLDAQYNYTRQTLDELKRADQLDINAPDVSELVQNYDRLGKETEEKNKQLKNIENAELFVKDLENIINGKNKKFSEGVYQSTVKKLAFDGIAEIKRNFDLKKISDKIANGEDITADEQLAIASYGLLNEAQSNFQSGIGYDVGSSLVEMVPYLFSFAVTGGVSKGIQTGIMSALKSTGEKTTKELAKKGIAYVSGQAVRPAFFSSLYSSGIEKQIGQVETTKDLLPSIAEGTKESPQKAFAKAYANTMAEVMTEQLGEVAVPIFNKIIGKEVKQALNPSMIDKIKDATAFNGFLPEMGEEFANEVLNTAIEGRPAEEIFDPRKILTTALTVGIMSSGFALSNTAYRAAINKKEQESGFKFDTKTKKQIDAIIESNKDTEEKAKELSYIVDEKIKAGAKDDEISNIVQYATSHTAKMKLDEVDPEIQKASEKKAQDEVKTKSEPKVSPKEKTPTIEAKGKITITEKVPMTDGDKKELKIEGNNFFTRQINKDGEQFGKITVEESGDTWKVKDVYVDIENQGYGKDVYRQMNEMAQDEGKTIVSEIPGKKLSKKGTYMWESLVNSGEAVKNEDGSYQMLPKKEEPIVEPKLTEEPTNAKGIRENAGQVQEGGNVRQEGQGEGGPNLEQQEPEQPGDEKERLARVKKIPQKLTHVEGLGMGMNQAEGVYFSTEKKNRYAKEGKKAKEVVVSVRNPIEFDQQKGDFHKVRTTLLNENKDKFTEGDFEEYQVPKKNKFSVDDLNDAGVEKLAKIVTGHFKKQGYDSIHFTGEGEGELVVFDKKAWKYKEDVDRDIHNAIVSRVKDYNDLPSTHKTKKSSALKDINNLVSKAGYSILQKGQGKIQVLKDGKPIKKITKQRTKEELQSHKALKDYENKEFVDFVEKLSESGSIVGLYDTGINSRDIPKAIEEIQSGVKSAKSNDLLDYLEQAFEKGEVSIWDADSRVRIPIAIKDILDSISEKDVSDEYVGEVEQVGEVDEVEQFVMDYVDGKITDEELKEYKAKWFTGFPYTEEEFDKLANNYRNENNAREKERAEEDEAVDKDSQDEGTVQGEKQSEIEPEVAKKLREVAGKIREGKISRIKGFQTNTPFSLAWDGGLEVLATTLEVTADLTVAVDKALTHIKNTDWYKNLTKEKQTEFDTKFVDHIENELGKEYRDATKYQFVNKEVGDRIQAATLSPKTFSEKAKEVFLDLRNKITRTYRDLPKNKKFAEAYNAISQFQKALDIASSKAGVNIRNILGNMQKADYDLFTYKIIFDDLAETIKLNPDYILPYALTPEALTQEIANINKFIGYNTKVQEAIKRRREAYKEIQGNYVEYAKKVGVNTEGYFERNDYFRHQVLLYSELSKSTVERKGGPLQRPKKLSLFKQRKQGKGYDINRNYIEAEFEVFNKLLYAIEKMKMIDNVYRNYDITKDLKAEAKKELGEDATPVQVNQWVEDNIPEGYVIDSPENMNIFMAQSIPESLVQDLMLGNVEEMGIKRDDLRKIFALGSPKKIIIPVELYKTMDNISQVKSSDSVSKATKKALTGWKIWSLIGPRRFIKYNLRNMSGDAEAVFLGNIRVFKKAWPAAKELYDVYFKKEPPTEMMNKYIERGGMQLVLTTQEIGDLKKIKEFERVYDSKRNVFLKAWDAYWKTVKLASDFREQLLRYAAFKEWVSEIEKNNGEVKNYGASKPEFIDGLSDKYDKAFRLSNELLGAYDEIGEAGQNIRQYWIPFWSFQEVNFRRTNQIFMNSLSDKSFEGKTLKGLELLAKKTPFMALKATKLALKLSAFWGMTAVWNALLFGDEEDDLPEYVTSRPHIILGRNADGTVRYLSRLGVMGDYLEWFGFDSMPMYVSEYLAGRMTPREISKEVMLSGPNKLIGGANPYFKSFFELAILKKSLYPDFNNPRVIRNNGEYVAIALGMKDEYRAITKLPDKEYYKSLRKLFWDEIEPKEAAYWNIIGYKYKFKAKQKGGDDAKSSFAITDKSAALYYYKQSLLYGDAKSAEHYLDKYILLGGTKKGYNLSMGYLNPMRGISDKEKDEFMKFIGSKNKKEFDMAMEYYDKVVNSKMEWPNDKMDKENEGDEIPMEEIPQE